MSEISVGCDEESVWRQACDNPRTCMPWIEIAQVSASKVDCITWVETILEFEHESGHYLEINDSSNGYEALIEFLGQHFSLPDNWYDSVRALRSRDDHLVIWKRSGGTSLNV
jgi:hypothetical protein